MLELLRVLLLPFVLPNLISSAYGRDGLSGSSISTRSDHAVPTDTTVATAASLTSVRGNATCFSRTANYITHTLPQQCLRTDRVAANTTRNSTATGTSNLNAAATSDGSTTLSDSGAVAVASVPATSSASSTTQDIRSSATATPSGTESEVEAETDSPLDNANFLSFEEWKKQNLAKLGQSPENVGNGRTMESIRERPINNALEAFGDEHEIDIDFAGFGGEPSAPHTSSREAQTAVTALDALPGELLPALRSKDAGKTCKERTNYASFDCAANILKSNAECKSGSSVLVENKDSYMLNTCSVANKFFIVELCDDILIDTVVLANYEYFSSMFRHFRVSVSDRYPVKIDKWKDLGTFEARNVRDIQAFLVERPQIWARFLRIEFLSHYGSEYYCPVSLLRVHGTTMLEDYRHQEEIARGDHAEEATLEVEVNATPALQQEPGASQDESSKEALTATQSVIASEGASTKPASISNGSSAANESTAVEPPTTCPRENATLLALEVSTNVSDEVACPIDVASGDLTPGVADSASKTYASVAQRTKTSSGNATSITSTTSIIRSEKKMTTSSSSVSASGQPGSANGTSKAQNTSSVASVERDKTLQSSSELASSTGTSSSSTLPVMVNSSATASLQTSSTTSPDTVRQSSHSSPQAPSTQQPPTQESFYKSVHKRLQQLESNSTLSLQYIEEQSRILRDAFSKVEKRQIATATTFLSNLNSTVMAELHGFRQAYDQLWQSTVIELEGQREQYQREMLAMGSRLTLVADELVWQKRMGIVQSTFLLLCLGLVLFARQGNGYLEMPLMQQMVHRSQSALAARGVRTGWESPPASPNSPSSRSPVSVLRRKLWKGHTEPMSGEVTDATDSRPESKDGPAMIVAPPTPPDHRAVGSGMESDGGLAGGGSAVGESVDMEGEDGDAFEDVRESRSEPATPRGTREGMLAGDAVEWLDPGASGSGAGVG